MSVLGLDVVPSARLLGYKWSAILKGILFVSVFLSISLAYVYILRPTAFANILDIVMVLAVIQGLPLYQIKRSSGYRLAWDGERIYMRGWGFRNILFQRKPFHSIAYRDVMAITGVDREDGFLGAWNLPYVYLIVTSRNSEDEDIWIYPASLNGNDLADFFVDLYKKVPDIFPEVVLQQLSYRNLI